MKRTLYAIAFILLAQISFGQIKTIKVQGAGGGIPRNDSVVIYTDITSSRHIFLEITQRKSSTVNMVHHAFPITTIQTSFK